MAVNSKRTIELEFRGEEGDINPRDLSRFLYYSRTLYSFLIENPRILEKAAKPKILEYFKEGLWEDFDEEMTDYYLSYEDVTKSLVEYGTADALQGYSGGQN